MQRFGGHVDSVWPGDDRSQLRVDPDPREVLGICERLKDASPLPVVEADIADRAVLERQAKLVGTDHFDRGYVDKRR